MAYLVEAARQTRDYLEWREGVSGETSVRKRVLLLLQSGLDQGLEYENSVGDDDV